MRGASVDGKVAGGVDGLANPWRAATRLCADVCVRAAGHEVHGPEVRVQSSDTGTRRDPWRGADTADAYAAFCARHGRYTDTSAWLVDALVDALTDEGRGAGGHGPPRILDWGAGTGVTTVAWCRALARDPVAAGAALGATAAGAEVVALEPSPAMAQRHPAARALRLHGVRVRLQRALAPPLGAGFDAVSGNSMWWILPHPAAALTRLQPWLAPGCRLAWTTPRLYMGEAPSTEELSLSLALADVQRRFARPHAATPTAAPALGDAPAGPLDPVAPLVAAGWQVEARLRRERSCSPAEWLAHTWLPPVQPPWLAALDPATRALALSDASDRVSSVAPHAQGWEITVARWPGAGR